VLLTVEDAADRLCIGRTTAWGLVKNGKLRSVQIGRLRRVPLSALDAYAARLAQSASDTGER
jgi:excisionase family DNA binding protein